MGAVSPALRLDQWSVVPPQTSVRDGACKVTSGPAGKPSLLDTLKAAAQEASFQVNQSKSEADKQGTRLKASASPSLKPDAQEERALETSTAHPAEAVYPAEQLVQPKPIGPGCQTAAAGKDSIGPCQSLSPPASSAISKFIHKARTELAKLEMDIPWEAVHKTWKLQRAQWRRSLKQAETVLEFTNALRELRSALSIPGSPFSHYGGSWDQLLRSCREEGASLEGLARLLSELKANARAWIKVREQHVPQLGETQRALAMGGLEAMWRALQAGGLAALAQCPLEAILDYDAEALQALEDLLKREIKLQSTSAAMGGEEAGRCPVGSIFATFHDGSANQRSTSAETASESMLVS